MNPPTLGAGDDMGNTVEFTPRFYVFFGHMRPHFQWTALRVPVGILLFSTLALLEHRLAASLAQFVSTETFHLRPNHFDFSHRFLYHSASRRTGSRCKRS
jgi:hypothetical protein